MSRSNDSLADILERVLDKGVVIAGDIMVNVLDIELLTLKVRLLIASVDTARDMGIDWWTADPFLTGNNQLERENQELKSRIEQLERQVAAAGLPEPEGSSTGEHRQVRAASTRRGNGASDG
ncbi:gas vesicle protein [Actinopolymorpha sp. B9G3]|uniref:gas vesicle protein n=1 Tax=Actinopolymorpha sp. B9G3 TaxID=3158970 RepID=UPI0032D8E015